MSSRETILKKIKAAQPAYVPLPEKKPVQRKGNATAQFQSVLQNIGGRAYFLEEKETIAVKLLSLFPGAKRIVSSIAAEERFFLREYKNLVAHSLQDVDVALVEAKFGVAENGAVWVTEEDLKIRVLPFICEHLVAVIDESKILPTLHEAYEQIGPADYGFGVFIAGPSKTADIEQSLVLGAHGPKSMTVLIRRSE